MPVHPASILRSMADMALALPQPASLRSCAIVVLGVSGLRNSFRCEIQRVQASSKILESNSEGKTTAAAQPRLCLVLLCLVLCVWFNILSASSESELVKPEFELVEFVD